MPLTCFLPKDLDLRSKCRESLIPSSGSAAVAAIASRAMRKDVGLKLKEKRLDIRIWRCKGDHQKGSHFPICVFTNNVGRRSPEKLEERKQRFMQRSWPQKWSQWWTQGSQEGCRARSKSQPRGDTPAVARGLTAVAVDQPRMGRQGGEWGGERTAVAVNRSDRWSATWNPSYAARPDSWKGSWATSDAGRWRAAEEPCSIVQSQRWTPGFVGQDYWTPPLALLPPFEAGMIPPPIRSWRAQGSSYRIYHKHHISCYAPQSRCYSPQSRCLRRSRNGTPNTVSCIRGCHRGFRSDN